MGKLTILVYAVAGSIVLKDYFEAGAIVFLFTFSQWLEFKASHKATSAMSSLADIVPQTAVIAETGERVNADQVQLNTILSIKPGDVIPIDGVVVQGNCDVDEKTLTGEWSHSLTPLQLMDDAIMMMISWILQMELVVHHVAMLIVQVQK